MLSPFTPYQGFLNCTSMESQTQPKPQSNILLWFENRCRVFAQALYFIDLCTGKLESIIFPLSHKYWKMYIFLLSKEVHSLKNITLIYKQYVQYLKNMNKWHTS